MGLITDFNALQTAYLSGRIATVPDQPSEGHAPPDPATSWPLGARVREARGRLSNREVAQRAGISSETLWQIENGRRRDSLRWSPPKPPTVLAVARALHIDEAEALELAGYRPEDYIVAAADGGPALVSPAALAEQMARLAQHELRALQTLVEGLLRAHDGGKGP